MCVCYRSCCRYWTSTLRITAFTSCLLPASTWAAVDMLLTKRRRWSPGIAVLFVDFWFLSVHTFFELGSVAKIMRHEISLEVGGICKCSFSHRCVFYSLFYKLASLVRHRISLFGKANFRLDHYPQTAHHNLSLSWVSYSASNVRHFNNPTLPGSDSATMVSCLHILAHSLDFR